jgi:hypothetical protein
MGAVGVEARGGGRSPRSGHSSLDRGAENGLDQAIMTTTGPGWVAPRRASDGRVLDAVPCGPAGRRVVAWSSTMPSGFQQPASSFPSPPIEGNSTTRTGQRPWRRQRPLVHGGGCRRPRRQGSPTGSGASKAAPGRRLGQGLARRRGAGAAPLDAPTLQDGGRCRPCRGWGRPPPAAVDGPRYRVAAAGPQPGVGGDDPGAVVSLARWAVAVAGVVGRTRRTAGHKEASCG